MVGLDLGLVVPDFASMAEWIVSTDSDMDVPGSVPDSVVFLKKKKKVTKKLQKSYKKVTKKLQKSYKKVTKKLQKSYKKVTKKVTKKLQNFQDFKRHTQETHTLLLFLFFVVSSPDSVVFFVFFCFVFFLLVGLTDCLSVCLSTV